MSGETPTKGSEGATHRLTDLTVFEVSLVDRPANKRPFLLVKSENQMPKGEELDLDEDGNLTKSSAFSAGAKKKAKAAMASAVAQLQRLLDGIDDMEDAEEFGKALGSSISKLSAYAGGGKPKGKDEEKGGAKKGDDPHRKVLDGLEADLTSALAEAEAGAVTDAQKAELATIKTKVDSIHKALSKLTEVVKSERAPIPAPTSQGEGETPTTTTTKAGDPWKYDMNSPEIDPADRFV